MTDPLVLTLPADEARRLPSFDWASLGIGPCARCGREHERYGPGGQPLCAQCRGSVSA